MFSQWISTVLDPMLTQPCWQNAACLQWSKALGITNPSIHTALFSYLNLHPNLHGPHSLKGFWRLATNIYCKSKFSVSLSFISAKQGFPKKAFSVSCNLPQPVILPITPQIFSILSNQPEFKLNLIWFYCHTPYVPPKWNINCWKVLQTAYCTAYCMNNTELLCPYYQSPDTLLHRYFYCQAAIPIWQTLNQIFPSQASTPNQIIN